jgi:hypothetical protein
MWTSTKSRFDFELIPELKEWHQMGRVSCPGGRCEGDQPVSVVAQFTASRTGAQAHKVLPMIVPSVMLPITAAPVGVRVISVPAGSQ